MYSILAYTGIVPFVAAAALSALRVTSVTLIGTPAELALSYGLAIICFLAGAHWATYIFRQDSVPTNLFITSNVVVLAVWIPYLIASTTWALTMQILAFAYLLYIDFGLLRLQLLDKHYLRMRKVATSVAIVSLAIVMATA